MSIRSHERRIHLIYPCLVYFLGHGQCAVPYVYCWGVDAGATYMSHIYRVELGAKPTLRHCYTFNHSDLNFGPYAQALGFYFFLPNLQSRALYRLSDNRRGYTLVELYKEASQALHAFFGSLEVVGCDNPTNNVGLGLSNYIHRVENVISGSQCRQPQRSESIPSTNASNCPSYSEVPGTHHVTFPLASSPNMSPIGSDQGAAATESACRVEAGGLRGQRRVDPRQAGLDPSMSALGYPSLCAALLSSMSGITGVEEAISTPGPSNLAAGHVISQPETTSTEYEWPNNQVMRIEEPSPSLQSVQRFTQAFSRSLRAQGLKVAYCWHCRYRKNKPATECMWADIRPSALEVSV